MLYFNYTFHNLKRISYKISSDKNKYDKKIDSKIRIISTLLENGLTIPIENNTVDEKDIKKLGLSIVFQPLEETINQEIINWDNQYIYDNRNQSVKEHNYIT